MSTRPLLLLACISTGQAICVAGANDTEAVKKDLAAFQGEWLLEWVERDGQPMDATERRLIFVIKGTQYSIKNYADRPAKINRSLKIYPNYVPKRLDLSTDGNMSEGIYKIEGDRLVWCWCNIQGGKPRPLE